MHRNVEEHASRVRWLVRNLICWCRISINIAKRFFVFLTGYLLQNLILFRIFHLGSLFLSVLFILGH